MKKILFGATLAIIALLGTALVINEINYNNQVSELKNEIELLSTDVETLRKDRQAILDLIEEIEKGIKIDKATIKALESDKLNNLAKITELMANVKYLESKIADLNAELNLKDQTIARLESKVASLIVIINSKDVKIGQLEAEIARVKNELRQEKADRTEDLAAIYDRLTKLQNDYFRN